MGVIAWLNYTNDDAGASQAKPSQVCDVLACATGGGGFKLYSHGGRFYINYINNFIQL